MIKEENGLRQEEGLWSVIRSFFRAKTGKDVFPLSSSERGPFSFASGKAKAMEWSVLLLLALLKFFYLSTLKRKFNKRMLLVHIKKVFKKLNYKILWPVFFTKKIAQKTMMTFPSPFCFQTRYR